MKRGCKGLHSKQELLLICLVFATQAMEMLFNKMVNTGQDIQPLTVLSRLLILLDTFRIYSVTHGIQNKQHR